MLTSTPSSRVRTCAGARSSNTHIGLRPGPAALRDDDSGHLAQSITGLLNLLILDLLFVDDGDGHADLAERLRDARRSDRHVGKLGLRHWQRLGAGDALAFEKLSRSADLSTERASTWSGV